MPAQQAKNPEDVTNEFIAQSPNSNYTFDSERRSPQSQLCREGKTGKECIELQMYATKLFEVMQSNGFFCALPIDPTQTHMVCRPLPKS